MPYGINVVMVFVGCFLVLVPDMWFIFACVWFAGVM